MGGWWSAADAPPEARVAFVRADRHDEAVRQRDLLLAAVEWTPAMLPKSDMYNNVVARLDDAIAACPRLRGPRPSGDVKP